MKLLEGLNAGTTLLPLSLVAKIKLKKLNILVSILKA